MDLGELDTIPSPHPGGARTRPQLAAGMRLGRFELVRELGEGGMAVVWEAIDSNLGRRVALKLVHAERVRDALPRLRREAQTMAQLQHPNIAVVHDIDEVDGQLFIAMELLGRGSLRSWIATEGRSWRETVATFVAAGRGLAAAHRAGIVHRDFKPDNVLRGEHGEIKVADFGLAEDSTSPDSPQVLGGTAGYMAPEQILGHKLDARADQFSFCVSLWEALVGARPFEVASTRDRPAVETLPLLLAEITAGRFTEPSRARVPRRVLRIVRRGLASDRSDRYPTMDALVEALERAARRRSIAIAVAVAAIAIAGVVVFRAGRQPDPGAACAQAGDAALATWTQARRDGISAAFAATKVPYAAAVATTVVDRLSHQVDAIAAARVDACDATHRRGERSEAVLDLRMSCLDRVFGQWTAIADALTRVDAAAVDRATGVMSTLESVAQCADVDQLSLLPLEPADPAVRAELAGLRLRVDAARARTRVLGDRAAMTQTEELLAAARRLGYCPVLVDALLARATALGNNAANKDGLAAGRESYLEAANSADSCHYDLRRAQALLNVLEDELKLGTDAARLKERLDQATAAVARARDPLLRAGLLAAQARLAREQGDLAGAIALGEQAVAAWAKEPGENAARQRLNLSLAYVAHGDLPRARELAQLGIDDFRKLYGPTSPNVAAALQTLANIDMQRGRSDLAIHHLEEAQRIQRAVFGPEHRQVIITTVNLAGAISVDRAADARKLLEDILPAARRVFGPEHALVIVALRNLAQATQQLGDLTVAERSLREVLDIQRRALGPDHPEVAETRARLGSVLRATDRKAEALVELRGALAVLERSLGADAPTLGAALDDLGSAELDIGEARAAVGHLQRARTIIGATADRAAIHNNLMTLATATWATGDRVGAHRLAETARDGAPDAKRRDESAAWLELHPLR